MKKRIGLLLVIVVMAWALVACGGGGDNNDNGVDGGAVEPTAEALSTEVVGTPSDLGGDDGVEEMATTEP
ncbi:MAG: hypothetical protein KA170_18930 [Candidatus Promineofilum sp.]|nr:hypothetical protein [Promineifilum sp.]